MWLLICTANTFTKKLGQIFAQNVEKIRTELIGHIKLSYIGSGLPLARPNFKDGGQFE